MKIAISIFCILIVFCGLPLVVFGEPDDYRPTIVVLDFEASGISESEVQEYSDYLSFLLDQTGEYRVIDRKQREQILLEKEFMERESGSEKYHIRVGRTIGAELVVAGQLLYSGESYILDVKLTDTESGKTVHTDSRKYSNTKALFDDCQDLVQGFGGRSIQPQPKPKKRFRRTGVGLFAGTGILLGDAGGANNVHIPVGAYVELLYPRSSVSLYTYWGISPTFVGLIDCSIGYQFNLSSLILFIPFGGVSTIVDETTCWIAVATGIDLRLNLIKLFGGNLLGAKTTLNIRTSYHLPFLSMDVPVQSNTYFTGEHWTNPFTGGLLYVVVGFGFTL
jgi:hypothetical protein